MVIPVQTMTLIVIQHQASFIQYNWNSWVTTSFPGRWR